MSNYTEQAKNFCAETCALIAFEYIRTGIYFDGDKESRDIYRVSIQTPRGKMVFEFGQSTANKGGFVYPDVYTFNGKPTSNKRHEHYGLHKFETQAAAASYGGSNFKVKEIKRLPPTEYDILACITKYHPGSFENFCSEYGYDTDSKKAEKTYYAVLKEYSDLSSIFTHEQLELMMEIN